MSMPPRSVNDAVAEDVEMKEMASSEEEKFRSFLLKEPFLLEEIDAVFPVFEEALSRPLKLLRERGFAAYNEFLETERQDLEQAALLEEQKRHEALQQAAIVGAPRDYQVALSETAKQHNTIVHLGTGKGKTLIALLCIRHFTDLHPTKQTLFLVPSVALAIQHTMTLQANLPYRVETACHTLANSEQARQKLAQSNIIVATHGAIHDLLMHYGDVFCLKQFSLLVFDECHYATGNHMYATIMKKFYHPLVDEPRPHVLGLTASPLLHVKENHSDDQLEKMLSELEQTLDAIVVSSPEAEEDRTEEATQDPSSSDRSGLVEEVISYSSVSAAVEFEELPLLENSGMHKSRWKEVKQLHVLYEELGPLVTSMYTETLSKNVTRNEFESESAEQFRSVVQYLRKLSDLCIKQSNECIKQGRTDKMLALEELLEEKIELHGSSETVGLVFVERRMTALALHEYFGRRQKRLREGRWERAKSIRKVASGTLSNSCDSSECDQHSLEHFSDAEESPSVLHHRDIASEERDQIPAKRKKSLDISLSQDDQFMDAEETDIEEMDDWFAAYRETSTKHDSGHSDIVHSPENPGSSVSGQFSDPGESDTDDEMEQSSVTPHVSGSVASPSTIRCGVMVRRPTNLFRNAHSSNPPIHSDAEEEYLQQEAKIREILRSLRKKEINVLLATSIAEEGIDVQACSFVAVFDSLRSAKAYIQMKGRARQKDAMFFVFEDESEDQRGGKLSLSVATKLERRVRSFIAGRDARISKPAPAATDLPPSQDDGPYDKMELVALEQRRYFADNGSVDLGSAKSLLNRYAMAVPLDTSARSSRDSFVIHMPIYEEYHLMLPAHLPIIYRRVSLPAAYYESTLAERHNMMALMACVRLHKLNLLSDRMLPLTRHDLQKKLMSMAIRSPARIAAFSSQANVMFGTGRREAYLYPILVSGEKYSVVQKQLEGDGQSLGMLVLEQIVGKVEPFSYQHKEFGAVQYSLGEMRSLKIRLGEWNQCVAFFAVLCTSRWGRRTRNEYFQGRHAAHQSIIAPYTVCSLTPFGQVDWVGMEGVVVSASRSKEQRTLAVREKLEKTSLACQKPRLWTPLYAPMMTYVAFGPSTQTCSAPFPENLQGTGGSYQDYYRVQKGVLVPENSPLFEARRLWQLPTHHEKGGLQERVSRSVALPSSVSLASEAQENVPKNANVPRVYLPQHACMEAPVADPSLVLLTVLLPQFLYHIERTLTARSFVRHCTANQLPQLGKALERVSDHFTIEALTTKSCGLRLSYDVLEWLGDAVLKLVQSDSLLHSPELSQWVQCLHEGDLTLLRSVMGSNERLAEVCRRLDFHRFILSTPLARSKWVPSGLELYHSGGGPVSVEREPAMKVCADVLESILGLVYVSSGYQVCLQVASELGLDCGHRVESLLGRNEDRSEIGSRNSDVQPRQDLLARVKECLGSPRLGALYLVEEAFTHGSAVYEDVSSYQRLEWVGDATLCLAARGWLYRKFRSMDVGDLAAMETAIVANETLAFVCVTKGLHKFINHSDQTLPGRLENYVWSLEEQGRGLWGTDPPKVFSDVVEAILGAVHVGGGFVEGQKATTVLLNPILSILESSHPPDAPSRIKHPIAELNEIGGKLFRIVLAKEAEFARSNPDAKIWHGQGWADPLAEGTDVIATIQCLGNDLVSVGEASRRSARNRACALVATMSQRKADLLGGIKVARNTVALGLTNEQYSTNDDSDEED